MKLSPRARWAVPGGVLAAVAAVMAGALISRAQASPPLPARTPAQLLAAVAGRTGPLPALTGTVVESASLGLPQLPGMDNPTSAASLLTGSHTVRIAYADPRHLRLAVPGMMSESDLIVNGGTAWYWQSTTNSVTRFALPARAGRAGRAQGRVRPQADGPGLADRGRAAGRRAVAAGPRAGLRHRHRGIGGPVGRGRPGQPGRRAGLRAVPRAAGVGHERARRVGQRAAAAHQPAVRAGHRPGTGPGRRGHPAGALRRRRAGQVSSPATAERASPAGQLAGPAITSTGLTKRFRGGQLA